LVGARSRQAGWCEGDLLLARAPKHNIYLIYGYVKSEREDLTPQQIRVLAELMKDVKDG